MSEDKIWEEIKSTLIQVFKTLIESKKEVFISFNVHTNGERKQFLKFDRTKISDWKEWRANNEILGTENSNFDPSALRLASRTSSKRLIQSNDLNLSRFYKFIVFYKPSNVIGIILKSFSIIISSIVLFTNKSDEEYDTYCYSKNIDMFPLILNAEPDDRAPTSWKFFEKLDGKHMYTCRLDTEHYQDISKPDLERCPYTTNEVKLLRFYRCIQCELARLCLVYLILHGFHLLVHLYDAIKRPGKLMKTVISFCSVILPLVELVLFLFMLYKRFEFSTMLCLCTFQNAVFDLYKMTSVSQLRIFNYNQPNVIDQYNCDASLRFYYDILVIYESIHTSLFLFTVLASYYI